MKDQKRRPHVHSGIKKLGLELGLEWKVAWSFKRRQLKLTSVKDTWRPDYTGKPLNLNYTLNLPVLQQELELSLSCPGTEQTKKHWTQTKQEAFLETFTSLDVHACIIISRAGKVVLGQHITARDVLLRCSIIITSIFLLTVENVHSL